MFSTDNSLQNLSFECCDAQDILMNAPIGIFTSTPQGSFIAVNPAMAAIYGYDSPQHMLESTPDVPIHIYHDPETRKRFFGLFQDSDKVHDFECLHKRKDGSTLWISESVRIIRDTQGKVKCLQGFVLDITARKQAEKANLESEERFRQMFTNAPMPYQSLDEHGNFLDINQTFLDLLGYSRKEIIGRNFAEILHPDRKEHFRQNFPRFKAVEEIAGMEFEILKKDGSSIIVFFNGKIQRDSEGRFLRLHCIFQDLTHQKNTENYLQQVLEATDDGIWDYDLKNKIFHYSERFAEMLGYQQGEINNFGWFCQQNIHPEDKSLFQEAFDNYVLGIASHYSTEFRLKTKSNDYIWVYARGRAIQRDASGKALRVVGAHSDINKRKLLEQQLRKVNLQLQESLAEQDMFFSIIAHDLKSPMSGMLSLSRVMDHELETLTEHELHYITREMHKNARGVYNLLNDLLEWASLRKNNLKMSPSRVSLRNLLENSLEAASNAARQKGIVIQNNVPDQLFVHVDSNMINTVLRNLIFNAVKFSYRNGKIQCSASRSNTVIQVSVQDQGTGMDEKVLNNLFSLAQKFSHPGTEGEKGTGLGMMLCKELIHKHDGRLWVESELHKGTTVYFTLPEAGS